MEEVVGVGEGPVGFADARDAMGHEACIPSVGDEVEGLIEWVEEDKSVLADAFDGGLSCKDKDKVVRVITPSPAEKGDRR